jgi:hypothetical protein
MLLLFHDTVTGDAVGKRRADEFVLCWYNKPREASYVVCPADLNLNRVTSSHGIYDILQLAFVQNVKAPGDRNLEV